MGDELKRALNAIMAFKSEIAPPPPDRLAIAVAALERIAARAYDNRVETAAMIARRAVSQIGADS